MATLATLETRRDELEAAIHSGANSITTDGQTVSFASRAEMVGTLNDILRQIDELNEADKRRPRVSSFNLSRGV